MKLTKQQARAMRSFQGNSYEYTYDDEVAACGVCPWPTMSNLIKKGLIVSYEWDDETGWTYWPTSEGAAWLRENVEIEERYFDVLAAAAKAGDEERVKERERADRRAA